MYKNKLELRGLSLSRFFVSRLVLIKLLFEVLSLCAFFRDQACFEPSKMLIAEACFCAFGFAAFSMATVVVH